MMIFIFIERNVGAWRRLSSNATNALWQRYNSFWLVYTYTVFCTIHIALPYIYKNANYLWLSPSIQSRNWIVFISVAYASWYHWNCGQAQRKAATINQLACPSPLCSAALVPMYYPGGMKARVSPVQWSKPFSIQAPLRIRTRAAGFKIISGDHYTTTAHWGGESNESPCSWRRETLICLWLNQDLITLQETEERDDF